MTEVKDNEDVYGERSTRGWGRDWEVTQREWKF